MPHTTLISAPAVYAHLDDPDWVIVDCRFSLADTERGRQDYQEAHIPGAVYAHLDDDLSGPTSPGVTGRHPLPDVDTFARTLSGWGIDEQTQVVAYDDFGGGIAARLWWMLRRLGHDAVAVLDGGWPAWQQHAFPTAPGDETRPPRRFVPRPRPNQIAGVNEVNAQRTNPAYRVLDARAAERFRGEFEPIDPVAGHIPGAVSAPFTGNLDGEGFFLPPDLLRARFETLLGDVPPKHTICYCGSGVTAAHNLLALAHVGMDGARLYPGSWSHWITDPKRPVEVGV